MTLDSPCECGLDNHLGGCVNLASVWTSETLEETSPGNVLLIETRHCLYKLYFSGSLTWIAEKEAPAGGKYLAFFVSLQFDIPSNDVDGNEIEISLEFTTSTAVVPDEFPFEECYGAECLGELL